MNEKRQRIGKILQQEFESKNISMYRLIKDSGVQWNIIKSIFNGDTNYTIDSLMKVAEALGYHITGKKNSSG